MRTAPFWRPYGWTGSIFPDRHTSGASHGGTLPSIETAELKDTRMEEIKDETSAAIAAPSRREEIRHAAEAILSEERRAALDMKMRQRKMRLLVTN